MLKNTRRFLAVILVAIFSLIIFTLLAQTRVITVPYFTPTILQIQGMMEKYSVNDRAIFVVRVQGYGSNCHSLQVETLLDGERVAFYKKADDCRFIQITHGSYNFEQPFDYGNQVLKKAGNYDVSIQFRDLIDNKVIESQKRFAVEK